MLANDSLLLIKSMKERYLLLKQAIPWSGFLTIFLLALSALPALCQTGTYTIRPLTVPPGAYSSYPNSINASGETVGHYLSDAVGSTPTTHAFYSKGTVAQNIDGQATSVRLINNLGKITSMNIAGVFYGPPGSASSLTGQPAGCFAEAGVTDSGYAALNTAINLYRYHNGLLQKLASFPRNQLNRPIATKANNNGYVVGQSGKIATYWTPDGKQVSVGGLNGNSSVIVTSTRLTDINDSNKFLLVEQLQSTSSSGNTSQMTLLGTPGTVYLQQLPINSGIALNNKGEVIGTKGSDSRTGVLYETATGTSFLLSDLIQANSGWSGLTPTAIADTTGSIVGYGQLNGVQIAFIIEKVASHYKYMPYWPVTNANLSGVQPFQFAIQDADTGRYDNQPNQVLWQVDDGQPTPLKMSTFVDSNGTTQPFYKIDVDVTPFKWRTPDRNGIRRFKINFIVRPVGMADLKQPDIWVNVSNGP